MFRRNRAVITGLAAAIGAAAALLVWPAPQEQEAALLLPDLDPRLSDVAAIELSPAGGSKLTLRRAEQDWVVAEKGDYPANPEKVRDLLLSLAAARTLEAKTAREDRYHHLGVQDLDKPDAAGTLLRLLTGDGGEVAALLVGHSEAGLGRYARIVDDRQAWLADGLPTLSVEPRQWLVRRLLKIDPASVRRLEIASEEGEPLVLVRNEPGDSEFALQDGGDRKLRQPEVERLISTVSDLKLDDVRAAVPAELDSAGGLRLETFDGLRVGLKWLRQADGDELLAALEVDYQANTTDDAGAQGDGATAGSTASARWTPERVNRLRKRLDGRWFALSEHNVQRLRPNFSDLIETADKDGG